MTPPGLIAIQRSDAAGHTAWVHFCNPLQVLTAHTLAEVQPVLAAAQSAAARGLHAVGWIAFEAAPAFDAHLQTHPPQPGLPLARFSLFDRQHPGLPRPAENDFSLDPWTPGLSPEAFAEAIRTIRAAIAAGETYQVNFTFPRHSLLHGSPWGLFQALRAGQTARHQAWIDDGERILLCASPELFFRLEGGQITCRPMKGTARPGEAGPLSRSVKDQAENVMIVDMIRNDLGKAARPGSVQVAQLFGIEAYPSLLQMTSTVTASGPADALPWLQALFPCASITGAPKRQTLEWIRRLETGPRGIYTGAIGGFYADGVTEFNVAIRTAVFNPATGSLRYDSGCGIVWDSDPEAEYAESNLKARIIESPAAPFSLIETCKWTPEAGCPLWPRHRARLLQSAAALGHAVIPGELDALMTDTFARLSAPTRLRLLADLDGGLSLTSAPLPATDAPLTFRLDTRPTPSDHPQLAHKTTRRGIYDAARARCPDRDETLLLNEAGELMEFCIGSLVLLRNGRHLTPSLTSGLLPGVARAEWIAQGRLTEAVLKPEDLHDAEGIFLLNAVRGLQPMRWLEAGP